MPSWFPAFATVKSREDGAREIGFFLAQYPMVRSHPSRKNKGAARVGHPGLWRFSKIAPLPALFDFGRR